MDNDNWYEKIASFDLQNRYDYVIKLYESLE